MAEETKKEYGLKDPKKTKQIQRPAIFNSDSESADEDKPTGITTLKKKERIAQQKATEEDPTIYQYDELYDDMQNQRKESKLARKDLEKKPKYINKLLESAERRKRENERRIERQVQKERDEEGDMFKDKESFVTSAYKKKLEELKELEEKEKREDYLETIGDVRKQGDLSGFYRHLYAQKVNFEEEEIKQEKLKDIEKNIENERKHTKQNIDETEAANPSSPPKSSSKNSSTKRKYRKRNDSKSASDTETEKPKLEHLPSNIDADSDFSIDSESSGNESDAENTSSKRCKTEKPKVVIPVVEENKEDVSEIKVKIEEPDTDKPVVKEEEVPVIPKKPKIDIWKKRTVGTVLDEALKRFYERKAAKIQSV